MREIKFRSWDKGSKQWVDDVLLTCNNYGFIYQNHYKCEFMGEDRDIELCQFTGLKDCKGKEIYEGDILKFHPYYNLGHKNEKEIGSVKWGKTGDSDGYSYGKHYEWIVNQDSLADIADSDYKDESYCEIIGNIYENKDLLECP